jgi:hypothetical protein
VAADGAGEAQVAVPDEVELERRPRRLVGHGQRIRRFSAWICPQW